MMPFHLQTIATLSMLTALACNADKATDTGVEADTDTDTDTDSDVYEFESAFTEGSSVSNTGQIMRQLLVDDMSKELDIIDEMVQNTEITSSGEVTSRLEFYFDFDGDTSGAVSFLSTFDMDPVQSTYEDISTKNLVDKIAGNDTATDHKDWSSEFEGWGEAGSTTPEALVRTWIQMIDDQAMDWIAGDIPLDPWGSPVPAVYVTPEGQDLNQLLVKFIRGAVNFSQGSDDYLDDDTENKGLLASHAQGDSAYTDLEHAWDEGFGYFGAARSYGNWSDVDIADVGHMDVDGDGSIDLLTEVNWGHSINAAKRDKGALAATDFTQQAWDGFYGGRQLLSETAGTELTDTQLDELRAFRDEAIAGWENSVSATCVHYINDVLQDMAVMDDDSTYSFADHAKHWSELKGFALGLQFNPASPLSDEDFTHLHTLIGDAPVLGDASAADQTDYADALIEARRVLMDAYSFDEANAGDENGENGW